MADWLRKQGHNVGGCDIPIDNNSKLNIKGELGKDNNDWYCLNCGATWSQSCEEGYIPAYCPNCKDPKNSYRSW